MTNEQLDILIKTARHMVERQDTSEYSGNVREVARIALESLLQLSGNSGQVNSPIIQDGDAACDRHYIAGVNAGWNFAQNSDEGGMRRCIENRLAAAPHLGKGE